MNPNKIIGFKWDNINVDKLANHGLTPEDVEGVFNQNPVILKNPKHKNRWIALGFSSRDERFILISFEVKEPGWVRVVTAYEPTSERWWKIYAKKKENRR